MYRGLVWYLIHWIYQEFIFELIELSRREGDESESMFDNVSYSEGWAVDLEIQYGIQILWYICWLRWSKNLITSVVATFLDDKFAIISISSFGIRPVKVVKTEGKLDILWIVMLLDRLIWLCRLVIVFDVVSSVLVFKVCCNAISIRLYSSWLDRQVVQWRWELIWWHWWQIGEDKWLRLCKTCGVGRSSSRILILKDLRVED